MIANMTNQKTYPGTSGSNVLMKPSLRCVCSSCFGVVCSMAVPQSLREKKEWSNSTSYEKTLESETSKSPEGRCGCCMAATELTGLDRF
jgi:hypothetical protein